MDERRPDPDELLSRVKEESARAERGRLKIFFGYAAGVGKTYAMLTAAQREKAEGIDVVVGYVEPHGRPETEALLGGLEAIPFLKATHNGITVREFDVDAALSRRPKLLLVDELAHTNASGARHAKRWEDVQELTGAGIDVWSTLNVQHVESLNDVVAGITGVGVRETVPDAVIERADEIELVDLVPDKLIERLQAGKVYLAPQAERALTRFFQKGNLIALRELALRQTADRLRRDVEDARRERGATQPWATNERLLVCVGPSPTTARLIRTAKRMAAAFGAEWLAVAVDSQGESPTAASGRRRVAEHLRLAETLGAEALTLVGRDVAGAIVEYARSRNVTKIVVGKTARPWYARVFARGVVERLLERSGEIDVYVITGEGAPARSSAPRVAARRESLSRRSLAGVGAITTLSGLAGWASHARGFAEANIVMLFLLGTAVAAAWLGRGPAIVAAVLNVLVFDFFFVPPYLTFSVGDVQYLLTFGVMLAIGLAISTLVGRARELLGASQRQERRTAALLRLARQLSEIAGDEFLGRAAVSQLGEMFGGDAALHLVGEDGAIADSFYSRAESALPPIDLLAAEWVANHDQPAGAGSDTLPSATYLFAPLTGSQRTLGAVGVRTADRAPLDPEQRRLLATCASLVALALERDRSTLEASEAQVAADTERIRSSLLGSVSHDLRTPLAAIGGAAASLADGEVDRDSPAGGELLTSIVEESRRLERLVENLLDMTRLEAGAVTPNRQWHVLEELAGVVLARLKRELADCDVAVDIPPNFPLLHVDGMLWEQLLVNLLENAARHGAHRIEFSARAPVDDGGRSRVEIRVADDGPGLPPGSEERIFQKFQRGAAGSADGRRGVGLGLAICHAIASAHGGRIAARNRAAGGAEFIVSLSSERPPEVPTEGPAGDSRAPGE